MNIFTELFNRKSEVAILKSGLYHYVRETEQEKSRIHLRIDPDEHGTLIVNASSVMHLNPTAAYMAWLTLEAKTEEAKVHALTARYAVSKKQAQNDLSAFLIQFEELIRPDGACPVHELELESSCPSARVRPHLIAWISLSLIAVTTTVPIAITHANGTSLNSAQNNGTRCWISSGLWAFRISFSPAARRR